MPAPLAPQKIGRYAIYGKIASGGMASVHFGRLLGIAGFSRTVAIKRLHAHLAEDPEFRSTLIDEARLAARIHHPNVVPTLDVVADDGELLVVMEYVRGESLARLLRAEASRGQRMPLPIVSAIVVGALHGLNAAHEATSDRGRPLGIVHRDVSPQNILVGIDGGARVIDFGVAKAAGRLQTTREGTFKGKIAYSAPEQLSIGEATRQVDVYAMAVVLWEALTGCRLFQAESDATLVAKVVSGSVQPPSRHVPDLAPELDALVMKGLARDPAHRFASAREMAEALMRAVSPAFPTEVGAWVEDLAHESLSQRSAVLTEIESASGFISVRPPNQAGDAGPERAPAEGTSAALESQPSTLSVVTPNVRGKRRMSLAGAVIVALAAVTVVAVWHSVTANVSRVDGPPPSASMAPAAGAAPQQSMIPSEPGALQPLPSVAADGPDPQSPPASGTARAPTTPEPSRPPHPAPRRVRPTTSAGPAIRFTQPD